jgi:hypothetical protein
VTLERGAAALLKFLTSPDAAAATAQSPHLVAGSSPPSSTTAVMRVGAGGLMSYGPGGVGASVPR